MRSKYMLIAVMLIIATFAAVGCQGGGQDLSGAAVGESPNDPAPGQDPAGDPGQSDVPGGPGSSDPSKTPAGPSGDQSQQPGQQTGPIDLMGALAQQTQRNRTIDLEALEEACGTSPVCLQQLEELREHLEKLCPSADNCQSEVAKALLYGRPRTSQQTQAGMCPPSANCRTVDDVRSEIENAQSQGEASGSTSGEQPSGSTAGGATGGEPSGSGDAPADEAARVAEILAELAQQSQSGGPEIDWDTLRARMVESCPPCVEVLDAMRAELDTAAEQTSIPDPDIADIAERVLNGQPVSPVEMSRLIEFMNENPAP